MLAVPRLPPPPNPIKSFGPKFSLAPSTALLPAIEIVTKTRIIFLPHYN